MKIETPIQYMLDLDWNHDILQKSKKFLKEWDSRPKSFYKNTPKYIFEVDMAEKEHLRNCIAFWEGKLNEKK